MSWLEVLDGGLLTTIQDAGRPGLGHLGIAPSGFLDAASARLANRLVGNPENSALLETTARGPVLRLPDHAQGILVAVTGAPAPMEIDGHRVDHQTPVLLQAGQTLRIGIADPGVRSYLSIRGGLIVQPVLGSCSTDLLSGLGPPRVEAGQRLPIGTTELPVPAADVVAVPAIAAECVLGVHPGPSDAWFTPTAMSFLTESVWTVSPTSSRVGLRLTGPALERLTDRELPPEGMVTGALQVPPDGQPVLLLADHPTTGGYPVLGVVAERDLAFAAQAAPGTTVRFRLKH